MKKNTLLIGMLTLLGTSPLFAQDLVVETMERNTSIELITDAKFDPAYGNVGNTSTNTIICLGEVDFGADGSAYKATGVEFAQGWGDYGIDRFVVLHAGNTFEESVAFNEMRVDRTYGYHCFEMYAENMKDGEGFVRPTGKQKVWLTFREGNGNLRSVVFYQEAIEIEGMQPWVNEAPDYAEKATIIYGNEFARAVPVPEPDPENPNNDPFKDCNYNEDTECWGGIVADFIVRSNQPIDFGNGGLKQLVAYVGHDGERYKEYMEFYIDEVTPENMIARTWSGLNLQAWNDFTPIATKLEEVTGKHYLFIKWGAATNLHRIDLLTEELWFNNPDCGVVFEDLKPSDDAVVFATFGGGTEGGDISQGQVEWKILSLGKDGARGEGSNIGYTSNGVVVAYYDIDFKNGDYKSIFINHSSDKNYLGRIHESNFSIYVDLENVNWDGLRNASADEVKAALEGYEPVAVVRAQGTGGWGTKMSTAAALNEVKGVHTMYVVYNLPDNSGANIYGIYLDPDGSAVGIEPVATTENMEIFAVDGEIIVNAAESVNVALYTVNGVQMAGKTLPAGSTAISNLPAGLYILKATDATGKVSTHKLMVK